MLKFILKNKIASLFIAVAVIALVGLFSNFNTTQKEISPPQNPISIASGVNSTKTVLEVSGTRYEDEITEKISVYDFMEKLKEEGKINFTEKNYTGMGKFIDSINGVYGNGNQNWIYYVNGKEASIGVSNYKLNPGDVVSWKYEKNI